MPDFSYSAARRVSPKFLTPVLDRIEGSAGGLRLARGMFWSTAGAVSSRAAGLLGSVILAHVLGKSVFGELGIIQSTTNMFATFATVGVGLTATKYVAESRSRDPERAGRIIALSILVAALSGFVVGAVMVVSAGWAAKLLAAPHLRLGIVISAGALFFTVVNEAQNGVLSGLEAFRRRSSVQFVGGVAALPISVLGVLAFGLTGAVIGLVVSQALLATLNFRAITREILSTGLAVRWGDIRREMAVLVSFSLPTLCCGAVYVPSMWIANMFLVRLPGGYAEMGVFSAADRWRTAILFLPSLLGGVTLPMLASLRGEADHEKYHNVLWTNIRLSVLASSAVAAPVALCAPWIMASYGRGFGEGSWVLIVLCTNAVAFSVYWIIGQSLVSRGHVWIMFSFNLGWAVCLLTFTWLLRGHGAMGLALAYLLAELARMIAALVYARRMRPSRDSTSGCQDVCVTP